MGLEESITYGTYAKIIKRNYLSADREDIEALLLNNETIVAKKGDITETKSKKIMLIDEVDVFFSKEFFGEQSRHGITLQSCEVEKLADFVWANKATITYQKIIQSKEFRACERRYPTIHNLLRYEAVNILEGIRSYKHEYIVHDDKIGYVRPEGMNFNRVSWRITFAYYYEVERGVIKARPQSHASFIVSYADLSYAELPREYEFVMGVSGTLKALPPCQREVLKEWYGIKEYYYVPSVYGKSKREKLGCRVAKNAEHHKAIAEAV